MKRKNKEHAATMPETNNNWQEKRWGKSKRAVEERSGGGGAVVLVSKGSGAPTYSHFECKNARMACKLIRLTELLKRSYYIPLFWLRSLHYPFFCIVRISFCPVFCARIHEI